MIKLRQFETSDLETYRGWVNDPKIGRLLGRIESVTKTEHERWYDNLMDNVNARVFAIETNYEYIGNVWLWNIEKMHRKAEVRIVIGAEQGKGYGAQALDLITKYAFEKMNLNRLYAYVFEYNKRAKNAFESSGFIEEGLLKSDRIINGEYVDTYIMAKVKE